MGLLIPIIYYRLLVTCIECFKNTWFNGVFQFVIVNCLFKAIAEILSLDANVKEEVFRLKRDLMRLVGVGEFSPDAIYRDPTKSYVIPEMICRKV